jgi:peptide/nickel transport system permease protein
VTAVAEQVEHVASDQVSRPLRAAWLRTPAVLALLVLVLIALIGPFFVRDPLELGVGPNLAPPSGEFWFGTDQFGMDIFARVVHAARLDLAVGVAAAAVAIVIGMPIGALAAMRGGLFDNSVLRVSESLQAFPTLLLALGIVAALGPSIPNLVIVIALVNVPVYLRLTRSAVQPLVQSDFVLAARCAGQSNLRIMRRHVLPNVAQVVLAQFSVNVAWAIQILAALSFIGLGVSVPTPEWGAMVRGGADYTIYGQWWVALFPGLAILATVLIFNQVADSVRR